MKNPYEPLTIYNCHNTLKEAFSDGIAASNLGWVADIEEAWGEYVIYPITIDTKRSEGCTQVTFDRKPGFPEFLSKWQERKRRIEL